MSDTPEATAPDSAPLSIEQAVAAMQPQPEEAAPVEAAETEETPSEAVSTAEVDPEPEPAIEGEEEQAPESEPEAPAIAAPTSWTADEKARFATLPRETQEFLSAREAQRDQAVFKAQEASAEARKKADLEVSQAATLKGDISQALDRAKALFAGWGEGEPDWAAYVDQYGADETLKYKFAYDQQRQAIDDLAKADAQAAAKAEETALKDHWRTVAEKLPAVAPELAGEKLNEVAKYLIERGVATEADLKWATAEQLSLAHDAMRWRQAQAKPTAPARTLTPPATPPVRTATRPSTPPPVRTQQQRTVEQLRNRLSQTGNVDDAVAVLLARGQ
jgi:hypothetical protein